MLNKYSDFINSNFSSITEGYTTRPTVVYWKENVESILDYDWYDISVKNYKPGIYTINFRIKTNGDNNYYLALIDKHITEDFYYMEDPKPFMEKFKSEFYSNAIKYIDDFKYIPKILGDTSHIKVTSKFNL